MTIVLEKNALTVSVSCVYHVAQLTCTAPGSEAAADILAKTWCHSHCFETNWSVGASSTLLDDTTQAVLRHVMFFISF